MKILKSFKFKLKPNSEQRQKIAQTAGCVRLVWNRSLAEVKESLDNKNGYVGYNKLAGNLTTWKKDEDTTFLKLVHSQPLQQTLKDLDRAVKEGFKKQKGFPKFKKKSRDKSFRYPQGVSIDENYAYLPKVGWVKFQKSREIEGEIKNTTVSFYAGHWYVSFQTEFEKKVKPKIGKQLGIDLGVVHFATLSNGHHVQPLSSFKKHERKLAKEQKKLSRKVKRSNGWQKQKFKVQRIHKKISNARNDFLHKCSTNLCKNHALIVLEDLKVSNMSASAKGNIEEPGKNVAAKSGLNKSILDQGWYEFRRMLEYKQEWTGGKLITIPPQYTSQKCSKCGHTEKANRTSQDKFLCKKCGFDINADINAASNILAAGWAVLASGDISSVGS